jgi:hypothetical protein
MAIVFRFIGPALMAAGVALAFVGFWSLFESAGTYGGPRYFWLVFVGFPVFWAGGVITQFAFIAPVTGYVARQVGPAIRTVSRAASLGWVGERTPASVPCAACRSMNPTASRYCSQCGAPFAGSTCRSCGAQREPGSSSCQTCGSNLVE